MTIDTIRERHVPLNAAVCSGCGHGLPCDTSVVLDALEAQERAIEAEAAQKERERLREAAEQTGHRSTRGPVPTQCPACMSPACFIIDGILTDPGGRPMTIDTIRERHKDCERMGECQDCEDSLGRCDTRVVLDALDDSHRYCVPHEHVEPDDPMYWQRKAHDEAAHAKALAEALRTLTIVRYRYVHQTGGKPTTDEDMDAAARGAMAALAAYDKDHGGRVEA